MVTGSEEYKKFLASLANSDPPLIRIRVPEDEKVYQIDWDTRQVEAPAFLGVEADHEAELIYFEMDRYFDLVDLSQCVGFVQFKNAKNEEYFYIIPYYDVTSKKDKIIFAWDIQSPVTKYGGTVQFSFKFFQANPTSGELLYELNTTVAKTKVLAGWASKNGADHTYKALDMRDVLLDSDLMMQIQQIMNTRDALNVYWKDLI